MSTPANHPPPDPDEPQVEVLDNDRNGRIRVGEFYQNLARQGITHDDPRLREANRAIDRECIEENGHRLIDPEALGRIAGTKQIIGRSLNRHNIIPDFEGFIADLHDICDRVLPLTDGHVATYIPQLKKVDPELFSVAVCTVDGQTYALGDTDVRFTLQSSHKPVNYALALEELGEERVHQHVGKEPSGVSFNALTLNQRGLPHNPLINAGAIMTSGLIGRELDLADRFDLVVSTWRRLNGGEGHTFDNATYLSERGTADRNFALAYFMRENGAFPPNTDIKEVLDFYFQCCAVESSAPQLARVAATFANSGVNPFTQERVFRPRTVMNTLSIMYTCGMYNYSGEFAFAIGLPAKSAVSGALWLVVPNVMGIAVYSPRLDENGNTVRGVAFARELVRRFNFHNYDALNVELDDKKDPRRQKYQTKAQEVMSLIFAASYGDLDEVKRLHALGVDLNAGDYDGRTALHLAAAENQRAVVEYLLANGARRDVKDRWGGTPLKDAKKGRHPVIVKLLEEE
ncbi:MAG: glutaminase A [Catalinimonas sp.]